MKKTWWVAGIVLGIIGGAYFFGADPLKDATCTTRIDTVYVPVVHREVVVETLYMKPKPLYRPSDRRRIDSLIKECTSLDSLVMYLAEPKTMSDNFVLSTPNGIDVSGELTLYSFPLDSLLEAAIRLDSLTVPERVIEITKMVTIEVMHPAGIALGALAGIILTVLLVGIL